ncbi:RDD family protein [uncultured Methanoregula sp.]|uniref:RDD family protein n=1 Tax=uncultured Methanoregula sp. TaxID=1005933 RepID=UPI002AAB7837|nr:RDD family protein [uncultured Methanoregula sp.]
MGTDYQKTPEDNPVSPQPHDPSVTRIYYAGFWRRLGAIIPDLAVAGIVALVINHFLQQLKIPFPLLVTIFLTGAVYLLLYSPLFISSQYRATPGKMLLGIIVVYDNGRQLPFSRALVRELGKYISLLLFGLGFIMIGFTRKKQGLHDLLALTVVVKRSDSLIYQRYNITNPAAARKRLRLASIFICICLVCTLLPLLYLGTMPEKTMNPRFVAAQGLSSAADTIASSKYPEYSLEVYDTAIEFQPNDTAILMKKMYVLNNVGRGEEARQYLDQMVEIYPNETTPMIFKGDLYLEEGKFQDALDCYEKAIAADPKNARIWIKSGDAHLLMAVTGMKEIRGMYRNLTTRPGRSGPLESVGPVDAFQTAQPYQDAMKCYNKAIELDPMTSVAISGRILSSTGNLVETYQGILDDM